MTLRRSRFVTGGRVLVAFMIALGGLHATTTPVSAVQYCNITPIIGNAGSTGLPLASNPYPSPIAVSGLGGTVTDVNVNLLDFTTRADSGGDHWAEDTDILLAAPGGANVVPWSDVGGDNNTSSGPVSAADITLDDQAANQLPADTFLSSGTFRPVDDDSDLGEGIPVDSFPSPAPSPSGNTTLATFNGTNPNGTWSLYVVDDTGQAANDFNGGWCVDILTTGGPVLPTLAVGDVKITEGKNGTRVAYFPVGLSAPSTSTVTVDYATADGTAVQPGDYTAKSGTLSFAAGQVNKVVGVAIKGDSLDEANQTFTVGLSIPSSATIADAVGVGTIRDDDPQSGVRITISDVRSREGNAGSRALDFTVSLSRPASSTVRVDYATGDSTATRPSDYVGATGTLTFSPGVVSKRVTVSTKADMTVESNETFRVVLSRATGGAAISDAIGIGTLVNDDP